jgi:HSP20 family protein
MFEEFSARSPFGLPLRGKGWTPPVDISEGPDAVMIHMDVPGIDADNIDISLAGNVLSVRGERNREQGKESYHRTERWYGPFQRSVEIPTNVDAGNIKANYKRGVLTLNLPKMKKRPAKKIEVETR